MRADNSMSRNFYHHRAGNFCIQIWTFHWEELRFHHEMLNLDDNLVKFRGQVEINKQFEWVKIKFGHLEAGNYQLTLRNISEEIYSVEMCPGMAQFEHFSMIQITSK
jgi:hypothetical protein